MAPVSEIKIAGGGPDSGPVARPDGAKDPALDGDWPTLAVLSRRYIDRALEHTNGNRTRAAEMLGISLKTLHNKLNRLNLRQKT